MLIDPNDVDTCSAPTRKVVEVVMCSCSTAEFMAVVVDKSEDDTKVRRQDSDDRGSDDHPCGLTIPGR